MKKIMIAALTFLLIVSSSLYAQERTITGTVTGADDGMGLPGVNIVVAGSTSGTISDLDGKYTLKVPSGDISIQFSFTGYTTQTIPVGEKTVIDVILNTSDEMLEDVVVTALGISKEEKKLAYAVSSLKSKELTSVKSTNVINSISGKVSGVQIQKTAGGAGGSTNVIIRGYSSLIGNNQPLYIVDGVAIDNSAISTATTYWDGGIDYGDGIGDINPDDIESLSVLKGPSASALYGSRAANGVVIINTKKGNSKEEGIGVEYTGSYTWETPFVLPNFQNEYGPGSGGVLADDVRRVGPALSWGPKMTGQSFTDWTGETRALTSQSNNIKDFYNTGSTMTNTIAISGGNEKASFRLSAHKLNNKGLVPTSTFDRTSFNLRGTIQATDQLSFDAKVNYVSSEANNRPYMAETMENPMHFFLNTPRSFQLSDLENNYIDENGNAVPVIDRDVNAWHINPYFGLNKSKNWDTKTRVISMLSAKYKFNNWLSLQVRNGYDRYNSDRFRTLARGTTYSMAGRIIEDLYTVTEMNTDFLVNGSGDLMSGLNLSYVLGGNMRVSQIHSRNITGSGFMDYDWLHLNNTVSQASTENYSDKRVNSVYGSLSLAYMSMFYLDLTGRNDWSSTLPDKSFFYPSASFAWAFTELIDNEDVLSFGKLRASWAQVGNDTDPYRDATSYSYTGDFAFPGTPHTQWVPSVVVGNKLDPERTTSIELGTDLRFFKERVGIDFAWYTASTTNQILPTSISYASGAQSTVINAGEIKNTGIEGRIYGKPVVGEFTWEIGLNISKNQNEVVELLEGVDQHQLSSSNNGRGQISIEASPGNAYGDIVGFDYQKDAQGRILFDDAGGVLRTDEKVVLGNITPDLVGGIYNNFKYKNFELRTLIDFSIGGEMFSTTNFLSYRNGNHQGTVAGREGGLAVNGATEGGSAVSTVDAETYWMDVTGKDIASDFVYDATYVKFRELSIGYQLPRSILENTFVQGVTFSLTARNLFFIKNGMDGIDPESTISRGMLGIEYASLPSTRSFGFSVNVKF